MGGGEVFDPSEEKGMPQTARCSLPSCWHQSPVNLLHPVCTWQRRPGRRCPSSPPRCPEPPSPCVHGHSPLFGTKLPASVKHSIQVPSLPLARLGVSGPSPHGALGVLSLVKR